MVPLRARSSFAEWDRIQFLTSTVAEGLLLDGFLCFISSFLLSRDALLCDVFAIFSEVWVGDLTHDQLQFQIRHRWPTGFTPYFVWGRSPRRKKSCRFYRSVMKKRKSTVSPRSDVHRRWRNPTLWEIVEKH